MATDIYDRAQFAVYCTCAAGNYTAETDGAETHDDIVRAIATAEWEDVFRIVEFNTFEGYARDITPDITQQALLLYLRGGGAIDPHTATGALAQELDLFIDTQGRSHAMAAEYVEMSG